MARSAHIAVRARTKSILKDAGTTFFVLLNVILLFFGVVVVTEAGRMIESTWTPFYESGFTVTLLVGGALIIVMSILGVRGACTDDDYSFVGYIALVIAVLAMTAAGAIIITNFDDSMENARELGFNSTEYSPHTSATMDRLHDRVVLEFQRGICSTNNVTGIITCAHAAWFQNFVNEKCSNISSAQCLMHSTEPEADAVFCRCQSALVDDIEEHTTSLMLWVSILMGIELFTIIGAGCWHWNSQIEKHRYEQRDSFELMSSPPTSPRQSWASEAGAEQSQENGPIHLVETSPCNSL